MVLLKIIGWTSMHFSFTYVSLWLTQVKWWLPVASIVPFEFTLRNHLLLIMK